MGVENRILLVAEDPAQRLLLSAACPGQAAGPILEAGSVAEAWKQILDRGPDLVLLDLDLGARDGLDLARELRARDIPVIVLSSDEVDRIPALEMGMDDFLGKPFHPRELAARIGNVLRRCRGVQPGGVRRFGPFRLHGERRQVLDGNGRQVPLTRGEFDLLNDLVLAGGWVRTRSQLADVISLGGEPAFGRSVDVLVSRLRRKLEADPRNPILLLTASGYGYRLAF